MKSADAIPYAGGNLGTAMYLGDEKVWPPKSNYWVRTLPKNGPTQQGAAAYNPVDRSVYVPSFTGDIGLSSVAVDPAETTKLTTPQNGSVCSSVIGVAIDATGTKIYLCTDQVYDNVNDTYLGGLWVRSGGTITETLSLNPTSAVAVIGDTVIAAESVNPVGVAFYRPGGTTRLKLTNQPGTCIATGFTDGSTGLDTFIAVPASPRSVYLIDARTETLFRSISDPVGVGVAVAFAENPYKLYSASGGVVTRIDIQTQIVDLRWTAPAGALIAGLTTARDSAGRARLYVCSKGSDSAIYVFDDSGADPVLIDTIAMPGRRPQQLVPYNDGDWGIVTSTGTGVDVVYLGPDPVSVRRDTGEPWEVVPPHEPYPEPTPETA